jgi:cytochrome P450
MMQAAARCLSIARMADGRGSDRHRDDASRPTSSSYDLLKALERRSLFTRDAFIRFQETAFSHGMTHTVGFPSLFTTLRQKKARGAAIEIRGVLDPLVKARYDSFHKGERQTHQDILQALISIKDPETGTHFDFRELCEQVAMLFLAGHETSQKFRVGVMAAAMRPKIQERVHAETVNVLSGAPAILAHEAPSPREMSSARPCGFIRSRFCPGTAACQSS